LAYTAIGLALGTVLRSAIKAPGVVLLWAALIQPNLDQLSIQLHGTLLRPYVILPDASANTLVNLDNTSTTFAPGAGLEPAAGAQVAPVLAAVILCLYLTVFLAVPAVLTRRRSIS
jgi:hypothetical protein